MSNLSSTLTLFLRIFIPTFWFAFFGIFTITVFFSKLPEGGAIPPGMFRWAVAGFSVLSTAVLLRTLLRLKRIDADDEYIYISNYLKHFRYPQSDIEKIELRDYHLFRLAWLTLAAPGSFGQSIVFIPSLKRLRQFVVSHPEFANRINLPPMAAQK